MVSLLVKGLPLAIMVAGGVKMVQKSPDLINFSKKTVAQTEINEIAKFIKLQSIDGLSSLPTPETFSAFLKQNMRLDNQALGRDVSQDHWGHPYRLLQNQNTMIIISDGPDGHAETSDDVRGRVVLD